MRAVVLDQPGGPEALRPAQLPDPTPGPGDVLVRVRASGVCGRDLIDRRGGFPMMKRPTILGHEFAGEVVAVGRGTEGDFAPGQRVVNLHRARCGRCARCDAGDGILCERAWQSFGHTVDGAYAELVVAPAGALVHAPDDVPFDVASTLMCTAGVALYALRSRARLEVGETLLVTGASGGVGQAAVQIARQMGARVVATTSCAAKVDALRALGAHEVVVGTRFQADVLRAAGGGVDAALELTGSATFGDAIRSLRRGGRIVLVGNIETSKIEVNPGALILHGLSVLGSASCTARDLADVFGMVRSGALKPRIDRTLPLEQAAEAHRLLAERAVVGRVVLVP